MLRFSCSLHNENTAPLGAIKGVYGGPVRSLWLWIPIIAGETGAVRLYW